MQSLNLRSRKKPEAKIQDAIIKMLQVKQWHVMTTHGNMYQSGFPDLYATHARYRARWIEVKRPYMIGSRFTVAQQRNFPKMLRCGAGIWILTAATEKEYLKLFQKENCSQYLMEAFMRHQSVNRIKESP